MKLKKSLLLITQLASILGLIIGLLASSWLPSWALIIGLIITSVFVVMTFLRFRTWIKLIQVGLSVLMILGLVYAQVSLSRILNNEQIETSVMDFYVKKNSRVVDLDGTSQLSFGISDLVVKEVHTAISNELEALSTQAQWIVAPSDQELFNQLMADEIDVWVVDHSLIETFLEWEPELMNKVTLIYSTEENFVKPDITKDVDTSTESFVILLSGVDTSGRISARSRSDVNILLVVNPNSHEVLTISIPRDSYVDLACKNNTKDKLTHAGVYGIDCSVSTIEQLFDIDINYYIKLNFTSFIKVVDVVGSIDVYSQYAFTTSKYVSIEKSYSFSAGINRMNAEQALFFSRERHAFKNGDVQRGLNQQEVIKGMINKLTQPTTLAKMDRIITTASKAIDTNLTSTQLNDLIKLQLEKNPVWNFSSNYLKGKGDYQPTYSMGSRLLYVYWPDAASVKEIHDQIETIKSHTKP